MGAGSATGTILVAPNTPDHYDVAGPANVSAGGNIGLFLVARDVYDNLTPSYGGRAHFTSSDATAALPGDVTFSAGLATPGNASAFTASAGTTFTATDVLTPTMTGTSPGVTVAPLAASALAVTGATSGPAGQAQTITVSAYDIYNNLVPTYRGTINLTSTDAAAHLPNSYTMAGSDAGTHTFTGMALVTAGVQTVSATDATTPAINGSQSGLVITAGVATMLQLDGPSLATAGAPLTVTVSARDTFGNVDHNFLGTVTLATSDVQASLPAPASCQTTDAGSRNLPVTLVTAGSQGVTASASGLVAGSISMVVAPTTTGAIVLSLASGPAGVAQTVTVRAIDNYNNTTPNYRGTVAFASTDARASLPGNYTYLGGDNGSRSLSATLNSAGP